MLTLQVRAFGLPLKQNPIRAPSSNVKDSGFKFPKHTELFADDYYDDIHQQGEDGGAKNAKERPKDPYTPASHEQDFERADGSTHRRTMTGVLSTYKKQLNLSAKDLIERDYWKQVRTMRDNIKERIEKTD